MSCGLSTIGYGGTYLSPYYTAYSTSSTCYDKYLAGVHYSGGIQYSHGLGWTSYNQNFEIFGQSAASTHNLCTDTHSICNGWEGTSDS